MPNLLPIRDKRRVKLEKNSGSEPIRILPKRERKKERRKHPHYPPKHLRRPYVFIPFSDKASYYAKRMYKAAVRAILADPRVSSEAKRMTGRWEQTPDFTREAYIAAVREMLLLKEELTTKERVLNTRKKRHIR